MVKEHPFPFTANQVQSYLYRGSQSAIISFLFHEFRLFLTINQTSLGLAEGQRVTVYEVILYTQIVLSCHYRLLCYMATMSSSMKAVGYPEPLPTDHPDPLPDITAPVPAPAA